VGDSGNLKAASIVMEADIEKKPKTGDTSIAFTALSLESFMISSTQHCQAKRPSWADKVPPHCCPYFT